MSLLARYAEHLFWLARYVERASSLARIVETHMSYDRSRAEDSSWAWLLELYSERQAFAKHYSEASFKNVLKFYVADADNPGSVLSSLRAARENARALRATIPTEMWIQLNEFYNRFLTISESELDPIRLSRTCSQIKFGCYAQLGVADSTLSRDEGWCFFRLGLMIERADQTSRLLDVKFAQLATDKQAMPKIADATFWALVLRSAAAYQAFHRVEQRGTDPNRVARFLLNNSGHPRAIAHCVDQIQHELGELDRTYKLTRARAAEEQSAAMVGILQAAAEDTLLIAHLHSVNDKLQRGLISLTESLGQAFFGYPEPAPEPLVQVQA